jgi:hypothetical protein
MLLHTIVDEVVLSHLTSLRITCWDDEIFLDPESTRHHEDLISRMQVPALTKVALAISSDFEASDEELLMPFASAARRGILTSSIECDPGCQFGLYD